MVSFGVGKKAAVDDLVVGTKAQVSSPPKKGFFRKGESSKLTTPNTPPISTPDSAARNAAVKERPSVSTIEVPDGCPAADTSFDRVGSALSDLSGSQPASNVKTPAPSSTAGFIADPPALMARTCSLEASASSSGGPKSAPRDAALAKFVDPPASMLSTTTESIVTKVLGIVDMSCASSGLVPSAPQKLEPRDIRQTLSYQPEWGVAPREDETSVIEGETSSAVKRELAEIASRASAPATTTTSSEGYRRHEAFELVYKDPERKSKPPVTASVKINKSLRINRWATKKWKASQQKKKEAKPSAPTLGIVALRDMPPMSGVELEDGGISEKRIIPNPPKFAKTDVEDVAVEIKKDVVSPAGDLIDGKGNGGTWLRISPNKKKDKDLNVSKPLLDTKENSSDAKPTTVSQRAVPVKKPARARATATKVAEPKTRQKKVLKSIKTPTMVLETVNEEEADDGELKVRVPGSQNAFLSDRDLIGSEVVEEIYASLDACLAEEIGVPEPTAEIDEQEPIGNQTEAKLEETPKALQEVVPILSETVVDMSETVIVSDSSSKVPVASHGYQEYRNAPLSPSPRQKTWKARLLFRKGDRGTSKKTSSRADIGQESKTHKNEKKTKPQWKAAVDPVTGNTYYYHKKTRETTWTKPPDCDLISPKTTEKVVPQEEISDAVAHTKAKNSAMNEEMAVTTDQDVGVLNNTSTGSECDVDELAGTYEEQEEFLSPVRDLVDSKPFDEPVALLDYPDDEKKKTDEKSLSTATARTRTTTSLYSGFSSRFSYKSRISEQTQQIKNLSSNNPNLDAIQDMASHTTSLSSKHEELPSEKESGFRTRRPARIPKNIPVPRLRELNVEEFTTSDRVYNRTARNPKLVRSGMDDGTRPMYTTSNNAPNSGDADDADADKSTVSYAATDSISALSEADLSFVDRKEAYDDARRRALDRAIAQEDWDLAAKLSESMRTTVKSHNVNNRAVPREWAQSEMDRFISENDWDAVAAYIAQVRASANVTDQREIQSNLEGGARGVDMPAVGHVHSRVTAVVPPARSSASDVSGASNPQRIFGARSQLQHRDLHSVDSHSSYSTTFDSEYTSESYEQRSEEELPQAPLNRPRQQEFAC
jgi:WW domain